jgi:hypothetical protein
VLAPKELELNSKTLLQVNKRLFMLSHGNQSTPGVCVAGSLCSNIIALFSRTTCLYLLSTVQPIALTFSSESGHNLTL